MSRYDVVVVGAGHNGLTAAALLARRGRKVLVVERRKELGGLASGHEFHPGYRAAGVLQDTGGVRPWVVRALGLARHGLELYEEAPPVLVPQRDGGPGLLLWRDPGRAAAELARLGGDAAERYREYRAFLGRIAPALRELLDRRLPDLFDTKARDLLALGRTGWSVRRLGKADMMELLRIGPMCVADWLGEWFESALLKAALAGPAIHGTWTGPWSPGSNAVLLRGEALADGGRPVKGGPQALVAALEGAARAAGVEIRTGAPVEELIFEGRRVRGLGLAGGEVVEAGAVAAACDPKHLLLDMVPGELLPRGLERDLLNYRARGTTALVHLALERYPAFGCRLDARPLFVRTGESVDELERAFDAVKYRRCSARPALEIHLPTVESPELAPAGHHVASILVHFAPYELEGGWDPDRRQELFESVVATLGEYVPDLESAIVGHELLSPADLESRYGVTGGHLHHGEHATDQLVVRPAPECAGYRTPFAGLYLCGSGSHPGGGITCAPGALAARSMLDA